MLAPWHGYGRYRDTGAVVMMVPAVKIRRQSQKNSVNGQFDATMARFSQRIDAREVAIHLTRG